MAFFNPYISTNPRLKKSKPFNEGATAGAAKASRGGKGREELKTMGERNGWTDQEVTARDVANLSADHYLWFQTFFPTRLEHAAELENNGRLNAERMPVWNARRMYAGNATDEEDKQARVAGDVFASRTPQFARTLENAKLMIEYMESHDLDATQVDSYAAAFRELTSEGKLTLAEAQSADAYLAAHSELHDRRTPPLVATRHQRDQNTEAHFAKSAAATNEGSVTRLVDYGERKSGVPEPTKYSFRQKIRSMSASEIALRCADDPAFKKSLDELT